MAAGSHLSENQRNISDRCLNAVSTEFVRGRAGALAHQCTKVASGYDLPSEPFLDELR